MGALLTGRGLDQMTPEKDQGLKFGEQDDAENQQDQLKSKALMSLKERRMRLK